MPTQSMRDLNKVMKQELHKSYTLKNKDVVEIIYTKGFSN